MPKEAIECIKSSFGEEWVLIESGKYHREDGPAVEWDYLGYMLEFIWQKLF